MSNLLPCPFCGWEAPKLKDVGMGRQHVQCPACGSSGATCKWGAIGHWNMRQDAPNKHPANWPAKGYRLTEKNGVTIQELIPTEYGGLCCHADERPCYHERIADWANEGKTITIYVGCDKHKPGLDTRCIECTDLHPRLQALRTQNTEDK
jgi:hypothetical protein